MAILLDWEPGTIRVINKHQLILPRHSGRGLSREQKERAWKLFQLATAAWSLVPRFLLRGPERCPNDPTPTKGQYCEYEIIRGGITPLFTVSMIIFQITLRTTTANTKLPAILERMGVGQALLSMTIHTPEDSAMMFGVQVLRSENFAEKDDQRGSNPRHDYITAGVSLCGENQSERQAAEGKWDQFLIVKRRNYREPLSKPRVCCEEVSEYQILRYISRNKALFKNRLVDWVTVSAWRDRPDIRCQACLYCRGRITRILGSDRTIDRLVRQGCVVRVWDGAVSPPQLIASRKPENLSRDIRTMQLKRIIEFC